jgi:membrane fusion protein (multidrug efflux system)
VKLVRVALPLSLVLAVACERAAPSRERPPPAVTTAIVSGRDVPVEIRSPVDLRPLQQADVGAKTIGYLDAVLVDRGDQVKRGQLLAVVRPSDLPDQLAAARGSLAQLQAQLTLARANRDRGLQLAPTGFVSQQDLQQQQAAVESSEAALAAAQSNVGVLAVRLGETRIESPIDGYVSARRLDPGALVGPSSGNTAILTVQRMDVLRVFVPVNERDVERLRVGLDAHLDLDALPGRTIRGKVVRISPSLDPVSRTLDAEVQVQNADGMLRPGMYGRASIITDVHRGAVVVPAIALQITSGKYYAFVAGPSEAAPEAPAQSGKPEGASSAWRRWIGQGGAKADPPAAAGRGKDGGALPLPGRKARVHRVPVEVGVDGGDWLEVTQGLKPGDEIVTAGMDVLSDGMMVRAQKGLDAFTGLSLESAQD